MSGTAAGSFTYTYNLADGLVSTTYPSGRTVTNTYDGANRISGIARTLSGVGKTYVSGAAYAAFGGISQLNYAVTNGVAAGSRTFSYNGRLQLGEMRDQGSSLLDLKYYYGNAATTGNPGASTKLNNGNPTSVVETARRRSGTTYAFTQTYSYDSLNRLNAASDTGGWTQNFSFDRYGNPWTTANTGLPQDRLPTSNVYTATNQSTYPGTGYDSGGVGNQVTMGSSQLTFDAENRIMQDYDTVTQNSACYGYDGLGERVYKQTFGGNTCSGAPSSSTTCVYDAFGNLMMQSQTGTAPTSPCTTCYLTWDHLGSVRMISDTVSSGFTGFHDYAPFGEEVVGGNAGRSADWGTGGNGNDYLNQRYTGAERDTESTLDFLQARYLANLQARFVSADPAGNFVADPTNPQSWNLYSYARNNPLAFIDPSGLDPCPPGSENTCVTVTDNGPSDPGTVTVAPGQCVSVYLDGTPNGSYCNTGGGPVQVSQGPQAPPPAPRKGPSTAARIACAADFGKNHSIAAAFGAQNTFLGSLFGGNTVASFANLGLALSGNASLGNQDVAKILLKGGGQGIPGPPSGNPGWSGASGQARSMGVRAAVSAGYNALAGVGAEPIELGITASGTVAASAAELSAATLGQVAYGVGLAKFVFDGSTFLYGYLSACRGS